MSEFVSFGGQPTAPPPMAAAPPPPTPPVSSPLGATDSFEEDLFGTAGSGSGSVYSAPPTFASPTPMPSVTAAASGPSDSVVGGGCTLAAAKKQWLTDYILQQNPDKAPVLVHTVDKVLVAYLGREEVMIRKLSDKYGVLPPPIPTAASIATAAAPSSQIDLLGGLSVPPPKAKATQRASQIDQQFLATLSPEFVLEQEQLLQRIKDGSRNERGRQRATTPPRGRTNERHQHRSRYGAGGKKLRRSSSLPIRKGLLC